MSAHTHPDNALFRAVKRIAAPEFDRKLSYVEQIALHAEDPAKYGRYLDWLFGHNGPLTRQWAIREYASERHLDAERERDRPGSAS